jgi:serine/threonine protein phosphatase PrpC
MENNFNITSASVSDRGLSEKRPENEDSFLVLEERGVYAVADGVGGAQAGDVASQMAVEILGEAFINQTQEVDAEDVMRNCDHACEFRDPSDGE